MDQYINNILMVVVLLKSSLQTQCNSYQNSINAFHRTRENNPDILLEAQKLINKPERGLNQKEEGWRHHNPDFNYTTEPS